MADKVPERSDVFPVEARGEQQITVQDINVAIPSKKGKVFSGKNIRTPRSGGFSTVFRDKKSASPPGERVATRRIKACTIEMD